jgi:hypothetical protein
MTFRAMDLACMLGAGARYPLATADSDPGFAARRGTMCLFRGRSVRGCLHYRGCFKPFFSPDSACATFNNVTTATQNETLEQIEREWVD